VLASGIDIAAAPSSEDGLSIKLQQQPWTGDLDDMIERRFIRVLMPYSRTLYFVDLGGTQRGTSYDLMRASSMIRSIPSAANSSIKTTRSPCSAGATACRRSVHRRTWCGTARRHI